GLRAEPERNDGEPGGGLLFVARGRLQRSAGRGKSPSGIALETRQVRLTIKIGSPARSALPSCRMSPGITMPRPSHLTTSNSSLTAPAPPPCNYACLRAFCL